jgi:hypothetical protein
MAPLLCGRERDSIGQSGHRGALESPLICPTRGDVLRTPSSAPGLARFQGTKGSPDAELPGDLLGHPESISFFTGYQISLLPYG